MKIYDISQEVFSGCVYPGDEAPIKREVNRIKNGDQYNLTSFSMCSHNGTHIDAPFHFFDNGKTVEEIPLYKTIGKCRVISFNGILTRDIADDIMKNSTSSDIDSAKRILFKGDVDITPEAAEVFSFHNMYLIGVESQSVGENCSPMRVHTILLEKEIILLEGIRLQGVDDGEYFLYAAPINLGGSDGAPCRAILIKEP